MLRSQPEFLEIAGSGLQQLSYEANSEWDDPDDIISWDWQKVSLLGGLTRLEISDYNCRDDEVVYLQRTGLVELVLICCCQLLQQLFVPGAFTRLEVLHIEDDCSGLHRADGR